MVQVVLRDQHVDLARLQRGEAVLGGQRDELDLGRIAEDRRGDGAAIVDVEAGPVALGVRQAEAGKVAVGAAIEHAAGLDGVEGLGRCAQTRGNTARAVIAARQHDAFHDTLLPNHTGSPSRRCRAREHRYCPQFPSLTASENGLRPGQGVAIGAAERRKCWIRRGISFE